MPGTDNETIVRQLSERAWNQGNLATCGDLFAPNYVGHSSVCYQRSRLLLPAGHSFAHPV